jgi:lipopolysaccharide export system permease protein
MFKLYSLYLASNFVLPFMVSTIFFVVFLMTFELMRILQLMSSKEISVTFIAGMMGDVALTLIPMAIPLAIFFSTIFSLNKLSGDSEYIALRSFGIKKIKLLVPFLIIAFFVAMNLYFLNQELVPSAHRSVRKNIKIISSTSLIEGIKTGQFFTNIPNITLFPGKVDEISKELNDVYLHIYSPKNRNEKVIMAKTGKILHEKNEKTGLESFNLQLNDGNITDYDPQAKQLEKILFEEYMLPISEQRFSYDPGTKEIMMTKFELEDFINGGLEKALQEGFNKKDFFNARYEYWNRLNTPVLVILLTFVGFGLGVTATRSRGKNSSALAIVILVGYYVVFFSLVNLARSGSIAVYLSMVIPSLILIFIGGKLYRNLDWQG